MLKKWWPTNISFLQNLKISLTPKMRIHVEAGTSHASRVQAKLVRIFFKPAEYLGSPLNVYVPFCVCRLYFRLPCYILALSRPWPRWSSHENVYVYVHKTEYKLTRREVKCVPHCNVECSMKGFQNLNLKHESGVVAMVIHSLIQTEN